MMNYDEPDIVNTVYGTPEGLEESQVAPLPAFKGVVPTGNMEGSRFIVVAWKPTDEDIKRIFDGGKVYLTCIGILPPHFVSTDFKEAAYAQG
jgi:hypothetical protein